MVTIANAEIKKLSPQLLVANLNDAIIFYTEKLGFEVEFRYEDFYAGIHKDGCSIHLKSGKPSTEERKNKRENDHLDIVFSVHHVENLYKEFQTNAIEIVQPLVNRPYGIEFYIADPDGYLLAYLEEA